MTGPSLHDRATRGPSTIARRAAAIAAAAGLAVLAGTAAPTAAWAQGASVSSATEDDKARAQELYKSGAMSFEFRRWDDALRKFRESYAVVRSPNTHLMIARVLLEQGQHLQAFNELVATEDEAVAEGQRYADTAVKARELRATLAPQVAAITVEVDVAGADPSAATVLLAGEDHPRSRWGKPIALPPGNVEVVGRFHGAPRARQTVTLARGGSQTVKLVVGPDAPAPAPEPAASGSAISAPPAASVNDEGGSVIPWIAVSAGLGAGGLAVFTVFGLMNHSTYDAVEARCANGCDPAIVQDQIDEGETQQTVANVGLVVGAVGVAAAATLLVIELTDEDDGARVGVGPGSLTASGTF